MTDRVKYGNCYGFDVDPPLNVEETEQVINQLQFHLRGVPEGEEFVFDLRIGSLDDDEDDWASYVSKSKAFKRESFKREGKVTRQVVIDFLREHFADLLTLPSGLKRVK